MKTLLCTTFLFGLTLAPAMAWEFNAPADSPFCQVDGVSSQGTVALFAGPLVKNPDAPAMVDRIYGKPYVALTLWKPSWNILSGKRIAATMSFKDGTTVSLTGTGTGQMVSFEFPSEATLRPWVHGFTSAPTGTIAFTSGNEPVWKLELKGTSAAISAMYKCVQDNELAVPAPLGTPATQPFGK